MPVLNVIPSEEEVLLQCEGDRVKAHYGMIAAQRLYLRTRLAEAQNWKCCWCGCEVTDELGKRRSMTIEHVFPRSHGGKDDWSNLAMSCSRCNQKRGNQVKFKDINIYTMGK